MPALRIANDVLAFALELWMLWAFGDWGYERASTPALRWLLAFAASGLAVLLWGKWAAPKSLTRLRGPSLFVFKGAMFAAAAAAICAVGGAHVALIYGALATIHLMFSAVDRNATPRKP